MVKAFVSLLSRYADICIIKHNEEVLSKNVKKGVALLVKPKTIVWIMITIMTIMMIPLVSRAMGAFQ
jgi:hypothetical protein